MALITNFSILALTALAVFTYFKPLPMLQRAQYYLAALLGVYLFTQGFAQPTDVTPLRLVGAGFLTLHFAFSHWEVLQNRAWTWGIVALSASLFLLLGGNNYTYNGYDFSFDQIPILVLIALGSVIFPVSRLKANVLTRFFSVDKPQAATQSFLVFFVGLSVFVGMFFASNAGIFLIALGYFSAGFYRSDNRNGNIGLAFLLLALIQQFKNSVGLESVELSFGKTLEGVFIGVFIPSLYAVLMRAKQKRGAALFTAFLAHVILLAGLLLLVTQKTDFGGMEAFIGALVGLSSYFVLVSRATPGVLIFSVTLLIGTIVAPFTLSAPLQVENVDGATVTVIKKEKEPLFTGKSIPLDSCAGKYTIDEKTVQLRFKLGPKGGVTEGAITTFSGKFNLLPEVKNSRVEVNLPVEKLTTFNQYRDESLAEEGYFNRSKYPEMTYRGNAFVQTADGYVVHGSFTMLGVTLPLDVELKCVEKTTKSGIQTLVLVGKSTIDRTLFGMKPDSKEGNVVEMEFRVELH